LKIPATSSARSQEINAGVVMAGKIATYSDTATTKACHLVEFGLFFILLEGLLRRVAPGLDTLILAFKFLYFPFTYLLLFPMIFSYQAWGVLLPWFVLYAVWGTCMTFLVGQDSIFIHLLATVVQIGFIPLAVISSTVYADELRFNRLIKKLSIFSVAVAFLAILQSSLPPTHWLTASMDQSKNSHMNGEHLLRASGTFQFCNTFASWTILSLGLVAWNFRKAETKKIRLFWVFGCAVVFFGGLSSGSRLAAFGSVFLLLASLRWTPQMFVNSVKVFVTVCLLVLLGYLFFPELIIETTRGRSFNTNQLLDVIWDTYAGVSLENAIWIANSGGVGWGEYTKGVASYSGQGSDRIYIEGGFHRVLAQTGYVGLLLFLFAQLSVGMRSISGSAELRWLGVLLFCWILLGSLTIPILEISVLAIPYWILLGAWYGRNRSFDSASASR